MKSTKTQPEEFDLMILGGWHGLDHRCMDFCWRRQARRSRRSQVYWRLLPEHRVLAQQEHHPQRESRIVLSPKQGIRISHDGFAIHMAVSARAQAHDGCVG